MKAGTCSSCLYWQEKNEFESGECHKNAPGTQPSQAAGVPFIALWPPTRAGNWCGDFHFRADGGGDND